MSVIYILTGEGTIVVMRRDEYYPTHSKLGPLMHAVAGQLQQLRTQCPLFQCNQSPASQNTGICRVWRLQHLPGRHSHGIGRKDGDVGRQAQMATGNADAPDGLREPS